MIDDYSDENDNPPKKRKSRNSRSRRSSGIVFAVWVLVFLVLLIAFVVYSPKVMSNLRQSDFFKHRFSSSQPTEKPAEQTEQQKPEVQPESKPDPKRDQGTIEFSVTDNTETAVSPSNTAAQENSITAANEAARRQKEEAEAAARKAKAEAEKKAKEEKARQDKADKAKPEAESKPKQDKPAPVQMRDATLFFLNISSSGSITRKEVHRSLKKSDSPLTDSLNELLKGPTVEEEKKGCTSLISKGTKLLSARVSNGVATLSFSEEIENNNLIGVESLRGQVQQIVYTATVFPTVSSVQILVNGNKKNYFQCDAEEQFFIGSPLSRNSF